MDQETVQPSSGSTTYSQSVQIYKSTGKTGVFGNLGIFQLKATLDVKDGIVSLTRKGQTIFSASTKEVVVTRSSLQTSKFTNGTILLEGGGKSYKVKFFDYSHPLKTKNWHYKMMRQKRNDFIQVLSNLGVPNLPPKIEA